MNGGRGPQIGRDDIVGLLQMCQAVDGRNIDDVLVNMWWGAACRAGWSLNAARDAVVAHYAESTEWCRPGHVTAIIRAERRKEPPVASLRALEGPGSTAEHRRRVIAEFAARAGRSIGG